MKRVFGRLCKRTKAALPLAAAALLAGCGAADETELRGWINGIKQATHVTSQPVPPHEEFVPFVYDSGGAVEPFDPRKILMAVAGQQQGRASPLQPYQLPHGQPGAIPLQPYQLPHERRREVLEGIPLDRIRMVGMVRQGGANGALIETNGVTHMVRVGNYLGPNVGVVTRITETELFLKEIVQDAAGEWVERPAKLELQILGRGVLNRR